MSPDLGIHRIPKTQKKLTLHAVFCLYCKEQKSEMYLFFHNTYMFLFTTPRNSKYRYVFFNKTCKSSICTQYLSVHKCFLQHTTAALPSRRPAGVFFSSPCLPIHVSESLNVRLLVSPPTPPPALIHCNLKLRAL